jgi:hypothetical protein
VQCKCCNKRFRLQVDFGAIVVSTTAARDKLIAQQRDLVARLLKLLQTVPRDIVVTAARRYKELQAALAAKPSNIEDVDVQRALIAALPAKVAAISDDMEAAQPWCAFHFCTLFML